MKGKTKLILYTLMVYFITCLICYLVNIIFLQRSNIITSFINIKFIIISILAVLLLFLFSRSIRNFSIITPVWSLIPIFLTIIQFLSTIKFVDDNNYIINVNQIVFGSLIIIWAICFIINWIINHSSFEDKSWEDEKIEKEPKWRQFFKLFINVIVFSLIIDCIYGLIVIANKVLSNRFNFIYVLAFLVMSIGIVIETIANFQKNSFKRKNKNKEKICKIGLWKNSRHPNYLGEIVFWFGIFIITLTNLSNYYWMSINYILLIIIWIIFAKVNRLDEFLSSYKKDWKEYKEKSGLL